jgi:preprotein translocase subunit SecG
VSRTDVRRLVRPAAVLAPSIKIRGKTPEREFTVVFGFSIAVIAFSLLLTLLVLMHKGKGGGLSDMFGGGMQSSVGGSSVAERNLDRITVVVGLLWFACIVALAIMMKLDS